ncbi:hypothetical protein [Actinokineospora iranica]|uniref:hypothetical protein n=1 Tax=Actinokineospora iranica TaxID=1271860 RepID=UPI0011136CFD|nr:hypothetical protein [Actinokineospora iranica]
MTMGGKELVAYRIIFRVLNVVFDIMGTEADCGDFRATTLDNVDDFTLKIWPLAEGRRSGKVVSLDSIGGLRGYEMNFPLIVEIA